MKANRSRTAVPRPSKPVTVAAPAPVEEPAPRPEPLPKHPGLKAEDLERAPLADLLLHGLAFDGYGDAIQMCSPRLFAN